MEEPTQEFIDWMKEHDRQEEFKDRLRRMERNGMPKAMIDAEILGYNVFPGLKTQ